jgi:hypothetical protein
MKPLSVGPSASTYRGGIVHALVMSLPPNGSAKDAGGARRDETGRGSSSTFASPILSFGREIES